jgi:hypothetical protein
MVCENMFVAGVEESRVFELCQEDVFDFVWVDAVIAGRDSVERT